VPLDDEVEAELEDGLLGGGRVRMGQRVPRRGDLVEEAAGDGHVEAGQLGGERLDLRRQGVRARRRHHIRDGELARRRFFRKNRTKRECRRSARRSNQGLRSRNGGHDRPHRRRLLRQERRPDLLRLALGGVEEAGQDVCEVVRGEDLGELDDAREVEAPVAERRDELRVLLDEARGGHPVVGRPLRKAELAGEEVEERLVAEVDPPALAIECRERDKELRERVVLAAEEIGEVGGVFAGGRHVGRIARISEASLSARIRPLARDLGDPSRTPPAPPRRASGAGGSSERACRRGACVRKRESSRRASMAHLGAALL
jgi:hypothetical protein